MVFTFVRERLLLKRSPSFPKAHIFCPEYQDFDKPEMPEVLVMNLSCQTNSIQGSVWGCPGAKLILTPVN